MTESCEYQTNDFRNDLRISKMFFRMKIEDGSSMKIVSLSLNMKNSSECFVADETMWTELQHPLNEKRVTRYCKTTNNFIEVFGNHRL